MKETEGHFARKGTHHVSSLSWGTVVGNHHLEIAKRGSRVAFKHEPEGIRTVEGRDDDGNKRRTGHNPGLGTEFLQPRGMGQRQWHELCGGERPQVSCHQ